MQTHLLRTPQLVELNLHEALQPLIRDDLPGLGTARPFMDTQMRNHRFICWFPRRGFRDSFRDTVDGDLPRRAAINLIDMPCERRSPIRYLSRIVK